MKGLKPMERRAAVTLYVVAMVAVIVGVDLVFFRNRFWERLTVNIGIVLVFAAFLLQISEVHDRHVWRKGAVRLCGAGETMTQTAPLPMISPINVY
jgi:hypothetical protein